MKLLIDTNVILDVILAREPWAKDAAALLDLIERGQAEGYVASHAITTVDYVVARSRGRGIATTAVSDLLRLLPVVPLETADFQHALVLGLADYEDAVQAAASRKIGADYLVTRNNKDFREAPISPRSPGEVLALLQ
ncbi:MAG: PIN domain-containing protein [Gemmatimonadaceae bacterium]